MKDEIFVYELQDRRDEVTIQSYIGEDYVLILAGQIYCFDGDCYATYLVYMVDMKNRKNFLYKGRKLDGAVTAYNAAQVG